MKVAVSREEHFNAAHRLYNPKWTDEKNESVFGKCSNPNYHGHNYRIIVTVLGEPSPETGYVIDLKTLSNLIKTHVLNQVDHKNLNLDTPWFRNLVPTAENIAVVFWKILREHLDPKLELTVKLYETDKNFVEYPAA